MSEVKGYDMGYFGNIWVRQNILEKAGQACEGHRHSFDHVSLLTSGAVEVEIQGHPARQFKAPTFVIIRKEHEHKFTALEDNTNWYCVFALRDLDGQVSDLYTMDHDPLGQESL
jgi:hypothetical protein